MNSRFVVTMLVGVALSTALARNANAQLPNGYGASISVEIARKLADTATAEGKKNGWNVAVAIVDSAGDLVFFERMDNT